MNNKVQGLIKHLESIEKKENELSKKLDVLLELHCESHNCSIREVMKRAKGE